MIENNVNSLGSFIEIHFEDSETTDIFNKESIELIHIDRTELYIILHFIPKKSRTIKFKSEKLLYKFYEKLVQCLTEDIAN